jgi:ribosomal protein S18 acetylase RimI-like enzyme
MNIRPATEKDLEAVAKLYAEVFNEAAPQEHWELAQAVTLFQYWLKRQPDLFFVAEESGRIVGGVAANVKPWFDGNRFQDAELFVHKDYRKGGLGSQLLALALDTAIEKYNVKTFEGITFAGTDFPQSWYDKLGLEKDTALSIITGDCASIIKKLKS